MLPPQELLNGPEGTGLHKLWAVQGTQELDGYLTRMANGEKEGHVCGGCFHHGPKMDLQIDDNIELFAHSMQYPSTFVPGLGLLDGPRIEHGVPHLAQGLDAASARRHRAVLPGLVFCQITAFREGVRSRRLLFEILVVTSLGGRLLRCLLFRYRYVFFRVVSRLILGCRTRRARTRGR